MRANSEESRLVGKGSGQTALYHAFHLDQAATLNPPLIQAFERLSQSDQVRKTHFFSGRYENIIIDRQHLPGMDELIMWWLEKAGEVLGQSADSLRCGFWFNQMQPGDVTEPHSHNDDDELLSGAYYLKVPENSGNLILHEGTERVSITPEEGRLVLFSSSKAHEVEENKSDEMRLSMGMNFGKPSR